MLLLDTTLWVRINAIGTWYTIEITGIPPIVCGFRSLQHQQWAKCDYLGLHILMEFPLCRPACGLCGSSLFLVYSVLMRGLMCRISSCTNLSRDRNLINWVTQCANLSNSAKLKPILYPLGFGIKYGRAVQLVTADCAFLDGMIN